MQTSLHEIVRSTRGLNPAHGDTWDRWLGGLAPDEHQALIELQLLLGGIDAFRHVENQLSTGATSNYADHVRVLREALRRGLQRCETLARAGVDDDSPDGTELTTDLVTLIQGMRDARAVVSQLSRLDSVDLASFHAMADLLLRELRRSTYFAPLGVLEFSHVPPTLDDACLPEASFATRTVLGIARLGTDRLLAYVSFAQADRLGLTSPLLLAAVRRDVRALARFFLVQGGDMLAQEFRQDLSALTASQIADETKRMAGLAQSLKHLRDRLEGAATLLQVQMQQALDQTQEPEQRETAFARMRHALEAAASILEASSEDHAKPRLTLEQTYETDEQHRLRIWMFRHILRAFVAKGSAAYVDREEWCPTDDLGFIPEFLRHVRALGRPLLLNTAYERSQEVFATLRRLQRDEWLEPPMLEQAVRELLRMLSHLDERFETLNAREDLPAFDKGQAALILRRYLASATLPREHAHNLAASAAFGLASAQIEPVVRIAS